MADFSFSNPIVGIAIAIGIALLLHIFFPDWERYSGGGGGADSAGGDGGDCGGGH